MRCSGVQELRLWYTENAVYCKINKHTPNLASNQPVRLQHLKRIIAKLWMFMVDFLIGQVDASFNLFQRLQINFQSFLSSFIQFRFFSKHRTLLFKDPIFILVVQWLLFRNPYWTRAYRPTQKNGNVNVNCIHGI